MEIFENMDMFTKVIDIIFLITLLIGILAFLFTLLPMNLQYAIEEFFNGQVLDDDKKMVKEGAASYITCATFLTLNKANPEVYKITLSEKFWKEARDNHSVVFKPSEARKMRKEISQRIQAEKDKKEMDKRRAAADVAMQRTKQMLVDINKYSEEQQKKLNDAVEELKTLSGSKIESV